MHTLSLPPLWGDAGLARPLARFLPARAQGRRLELRIDVQQRPDDIEGELEALYRRLSTPGDALHGIPTLPLPRPGFRFHHREADGEHYVYVEDIAGKRLAGYTVFNRLIEVDRRTDPHVRAPHSKYAPAYQRRGLASTVYRWALAAGICLISGARQSGGAHALWLALGRQHRLGYVALRHKKLHFLGTEVLPAVRDDLNVRMILLGEGWAFGRLPGAR